MCQQSPNLGSLPTGATSAHHFVTPTSKRCAPIAHKIDVALGARETMRRWVMWFCVLTEPSLADWKVRVPSAACEKIPGPKEKPQ
jgi:hypothetical protein